MLWINLMAALLIGLASSAHCVFMCGGLSAALQPKSKLPKARRMLISSSFQIGRLLSYAFIGAVLGGVLVLADSVMQLGAYLRIFAGLLLIAMGLYLANIWSGLAYVEKFFQPAWKQINKPMQSWFPISRISHSLMVGAVWGWLPCGLVYSTLAWSVSVSDSALQASSLMFAMGLGTLPAVMGIGLMGQIFSRTRTRRFASACLCLFGLWTLWMPVQSMFQPHMHSVNNGTHEEHRAHH